MARRRRTGPCKRAQCKVVAQYMKLESERRGLGRHVKSPLSCGERLSAGRGLSSARARQRPSGFGPFCWHPKKLHNYYFRPLVVVQRGSASFRDHFRDIICLSEPRRCAYDDTHTRARHKYSRAFHQKKTHSPPLRVCLVFVLVIIKFSRQSRANKLVSQLTGWLTNKL